MPANQPTSLRWQRAGRAPLVVLAMACLVAAVWGGLLRLGVQLPTPEHGANWITLHGPLMICGFLGTVIGLERAVGLRTWWTYLPPILTAAGSLAMVAGVTAPHPVWLVTAGSAVFAAVAWRVVALQKALFTLLMAIAAMCWLVGNVLWTQGWPFNRIVPWWIAFLGLTIVGERLDLNRFTRPSPWARPLFFAALAPCLTGVIASAWHPLWGERLTGAGLLALALWLGWFDLARRTLRHPGLPRFMAVCLLTGYVWMSLSGILMMRFSPLESGPFPYDAVLHTFFVGFVFSMIFGHAPVIFPAILNFTATWRPVLYAHVTMLHGALALRVMGDLLDIFWARQWGAIFNAVAVALFLLNTVASVVIPPKSQLKRPPIS
ncbi:MAG: hypothetical protein N3J91_09830 [Verrucomicrobiae bacterium]|nr:hypothetical protein [Verrucomicrobiae bacterium]